MDHSRHKWPTLSLGGYQSQDEGRRLALALALHDAVDEMVFEPRGHHVPRQQHLHVGGKGFKAQSKVVAQLTLSVAITVLHRSCSVAAEPLHR